MSDYVIRAKNIGKCYQIYDKPRDRLKQSLFRGRRQFYREFWALRNVSFEVKKGEVLGIIGRNGAGKSTLLQLLCNTLTPTTGELHVKGRVAALLELGAGFNPEFTGRDNVYMNGAILGFSHQEMEALFDEIEAFADIGEFIDQPVKTYSSGMFVRLAFAVQACVEPDVLIIDEALAVGDVFFRQKCYQRLARLLEKGTAVLLVTHAMGDVEEFCDHALLLHHGEPIFQGAAVEAVKRYYLVESKGQKNGFAPSLIEIEQMEFSEQGSFAWPAPGEFLDISNISQVSSGMARCTAVALCNEQGKAQNSFSQGEKASFFYEFELFSTIPVPFAGVVIQNDKGTIVHGKHTLQQNIPLPLCVKNGQRIRFRQDIVLDVGVGEYTFELGFGAMDVADYKNRASLSHAHFDDHVARLCELTKISCFAVTLGNINECGQLPFHGIANLPGTSSILVIEE